MIKLRTHSRELRPWSPLFDECLPKHHHVHLGEYLPLPDALLVCGGS
jgi:hypothetical protein